MTLVNYTETRMKNTSDLTNSDGYHSLSPFNITLWIMYLLVIFVGVAGNVMVVCIVYRFRSMHSTTNYLISNLAIADSVSLIFCPIPIAVEFSNNSFIGSVGQFVCKVFTGNFLSQVSISASFTTLIFLATDRYYAMVKPFHTRFIVSPERFRHVIGFIWLVSLLCCVPILVGSEVDELSQRCLSAWTIEKPPFMRVYLTSVAIFYVATFFLLSYCYTQILKGLCISKTVFSRDFATEFKKKFALISLTVTLSFCVCYAPFLFFHVYLAFQDANTLVENHETLLIANRITRFIFYLSGSLNHLLYAFQSSRYRGNLRKILRLKTPSRVGVSVIPLKDMK